MSVPSELALAPNGLGNTTSPIKFVESNINRDLQFEFIGNDISYGTNNTSVYLVKKSDTGEILAAKVKPKSSMNQNSFYKEQEILKSVVHHSLLKFVDFIDSDEEFFFQPDVEHKH